MTETLAYVPGMCNINRSEVAYRKKAMWFGIGLSLVVLIPCLSFTVNPFVTAALLFVPVYISAIGFLQVRNKFCVSYGSKGLQNADEESKSAQTIEDASALKQDRKKAREMNIIALISTLAVIMIAAATTVLV